MLGYKKGSKPNIFDSAIHNAQVSKIFGQHISGLKQAKFSAWR